jgi:hypothetical protein
VSTAPVSKARAYRVNATGRTRVLVPPQPVPRKVTVSVIGPGSLYVSQDAKRELRDRPELYGQRELPPDVRLPVTLSPGRGMWCITQGPIVPVSVQIEYLWDQDPSESIDDYALVQSVQDISGYDQIANRNFNGVLCNDPWMLMVERAAEDATQPGRVSEGVV